MKQWNSKSKIYFLALFLHVSANFDCEPSVSSSFCGTELRCIYDEVYKSRTNFCVCKLVLNAVSLPGNSLKDNLLETACSVNKEKLQELQINDAELETIDDHIFRSYRNLKILNLAGNKLKPNFSPQSAGIEQLNLKSNELSALNSSLFKELKLLKVLTLSFNKLEEFGPFADFPDLEEIHLDGNRLVILGNDFERLPKLRVLNLNNNFLVSWGKLVSDSLQELHLSHNKLTSLNRNEFDKLPKLRILDVSHNLISSLIGGFGNLDTSNFGTKLVQTPFQVPGQENSRFNPSQAFGAFMPNPNYAQFRRSKRQSGFFINWGAPVNQNLQNLPSGATWSKLQELNMAENRIESIPGGFFSGLGDLRKLNVSHNKLGSFDFNELSGSLRLILLDLKGNKVGKLDLQVLKDKWILLKVVDFDVDLEKCGDFRDVLGYFKENGVVVKSCNTARGCCGVY